MFKNMAMVEIFTSWKIERYLHYLIFLAEFWGRESAVAVATRYGLYGPGIESRWRRDFPHPSRSAMGPIQPHIQWVPVLCRG